jgi:glycosyltransferase involved in cell wall biosynthesis
MGGGPTANIAIKAAKENPWIHYFPPKFENDKIPYFLLSKAVLMPFAVGLVMLDSFALGTPLLTTHNKKNGPEIDYLIDGYNGLFAKGESISEYSNLIELFFTDKDLQRKIQFGCQQSAKYYSIQEMVGRFVSGIKETLEK